MNKPSDISGVRDYIRGLELAPRQSTLSAGGGPGAEDNGKAGYVDDGSLVSFVAGVSSLHQSDALNSTLLAQLAANKQYDREEKPVEWYKFYRDVLETVGWVVPDYEFQKFNGGAATFTADEVIIKLLESIATQDDLAIVTETIEALKVLSDDDDRVKLFDSSSTSLSKGNFQIGAVGESDGVLVMKIGTFYFSTDRTVTRVLFFEFSSAKTEFYQGSQTMNLNEDVYRQVRQVVIDKLGDNARTRIGSLEI